MPGLPSFTLLPPGVGPEAAPLLAAKGLRAFGDGFVAVLLPVYLLGLGYDAVTVGVIGSATLLGSALMTLAVGMVGHRFGRRGMLLAASLLMVATGLGFAMTATLGPLLVIAFVGTLNPTAGDVSVFLPLEQSILAMAAGDERRTAMFARYSLIGSVAGALGSLAAVLPDNLASLDIAPDTAMRGMFLLYAAIGAACLPLYRRLPRSRTEAVPATAALGSSRGIVYRLAALFSLDAFAGGFIVQSLLALWLFQRFGLSVAAAGAFFFWSGLLTAFSYLVAASISRRFGLINTMVFTHLPSSLCLILAAIAPSLGTALGLLLVRSALSQMDVPTRTSYVMAVVTPAERPAAAAVTSVPRSLAAAASPAIAGWLIGAALPGLPLILCGSLKIVYDLMLLAGFRHHRPPEERRTL